MDLSSVEYLYACMLIQRTAENLVASYGFTIYWSTVYAAINYCLNERLTPWTFLNWYYLQIVWLPGKLTMSGNLISCISSVLDIWVNLNVCISNVSSELNIWVDLNIYISNVSSELNIWVNLIVCYKFIRLHKFLCRVPDAGVHLESLWTPSNFQIEGVILFLHQATGSPCGVHVESTGSRCWPWTPAKFDQRRSEPGVSLESMWSPPGVQAHFDIFWHFTWSPPGVHLESLESTWSLPEPVGQCKVLGWWGVFCCR